MMTVLFIVLWLCVSLLCLRCINKDKDNEEEWLKLSIVYRTLTLPLIPVIYIALAGWEAIEK